MPFQCTIYIMYSASTNFLKQAARDEMLKLWKCTKILCRLNNLNSVHSTFWFIEVNIVTFYTFCITDDKHPYSATAYVNSLILELNDCYVLCRKKKEKGFL